MRFSRISLLNSRLSVVCEWGRCLVIEELMEWRAAGKSVPSGAPRPSLTPPWPRFICILIPALECHRRGAAATCCCHSNRLGDRRGFRDFGEFICRIFITLIISVIFINARLSQAYMMSFISIYCSETQTQPRPAGRSAESDQIWWKLITLNRRLSDNPLRALKYCKWLALSLTCYPEISSSEVLR